MMMNYSQLDSLNHDEFIKETQDNPAKGKDATKSDANDLEKIENLLDLQPGILKGQDLYVGKAQCKCGRTFTFYDVVFTALVEQWHDSSFVAHTLLGRKFLINKPRHIRCSSCGVREAKCLDNWYDMARYGCSRHCDLE